MKSPLLAILCGGLLASSATPVRADEIPEKDRPTVRQGLEWLVKQQHRDGNWAGNNGAYPVPLTALAGLAFLAEGSTVGEGKYAGNIKRAAEWLMARCQKGKHDGLIGNPDNPNEVARYMYGHGYATAFLAGVFGEAANARQRDRIRDVLNRAVQYSVKAQSTRGGWYYISAVEGHDLDEGSVTVVQMQGLRAARNAGIATPRATLDKGLAYLKDLTTPTGGVLYSTGRHASPAGARPALTAGALACGVTGGDYRSDLAKKWLKFCQQHIPHDFGRRLGYDEFTHYYYAQVVYHLGDDRWGKLFPGTPKEECVTWSKYRAALFDHLQRTQNADGSWPSGDFTVGPVYTTAVYLNIVQLENSAPILHHR
jgi:hypothetical protein